VKREDGFHEYYCETRADRLRELHEMNGTPVVGLWEAGILRVEGSRVRLLGSPARLFLKGQEPRDVEPGASLDQLLSR
jgi:hypothetical protein